MATKPKRRQPTEKVGREIPLIADGVQWRRVEAPHIWRPMREGETLVGRFVGRRMRAGVYGPYSIVLIQTDKATTTVSGTVVNSLFDAAGIDEGTIVRIVYLGDRMSSPSGRTYRAFELFVADAHVSRRTDHGGASDGYSKAVR